MGLLTGSKNDAVSATNVQANRNGSTGSRSRVTRLYIMGVKIRAVASFERNIEMRLPRRKVFRNRRRELFPESRAAWNANQSNNPAASASADRLIIPRKNRKVFQSFSNTVPASTGLIRPRR